MSEYDCLFKLVMVGDSSVGKSSMLGRFVDERFSETYISTIGVDFKTKTIEMDGKMVKIQVWDTAGQERFRTITSTYYRGAHGILLVYSATSKESFTSSIERWLVEVRKYSSPETVIYLVANKIDNIENVVVPYECGKTTAVMEKLHFCECSAKTGAGIENMFTSIVRSIYNVRNPTTTEKDNGLIILNGSLITQSSAKSSSCC